MVIRPITRSPLLLLTLSICLALPVLAVSTHILSIYRSEHASNPWWLPIWHAHFNTHGLIAVITCSSIILTFDVISVGVVIAGNKTGGKNKMIKWTTVVFMSAATIVALIALIMPAVANAAAPSKSDTVQTWTCRWKGAVGAPDSFGPLCRESQFSSYALIPLFILHLLLLVQSIQDAVAAPQPKPQTLDEELVIITKSVQVATTDSKESPRIHEQHQA
ncbi:hypothetical protein E4T50_01567 [Aureobasidium sp. EXF-12298]|nr:hypothetical protein E4T50_01567 [Aureobasidium sp. EXF-12298]KAI4762357.1 hypothetical protein E4T51_04658 [Aureobasidium sp. EXF-12344]KAI4780111.1 hypothetical protein E4T52_04989 [Aureobasidium sp. EXF-3400]